MTREEKLAFVRSHLGDWKRDWEIYRIKELNENQFLFGWVHEEDNTGKTFAPRPDGDLTCGTLDQACDHLQGFLIGDFKKMGGSLLMDWCAS